MAKIQKTEEEWREELGEERYRIMREKGTEPPGSGEHLKMDEQGAYRCAACGAELFHSDAKFDSGTGWPSFWAPLAEGRIEITLDTSQGMERKEILCANCGSHLGHVFEDGPPDKTGLRYCVNSLALEFQGQEEE